MIYDAHCHLHEYSDNEVAEFLREEITITAVSDDLESSVRTLRLWEKFGDRVVPCIGVHPWQVREVRERDVERIIELAERFRVRCLGEIGIDTVFTPDTLTRQLEVFIQFLEYVSGGRTLVLNIHSPGAWGRVLQLLYRYDIGHALFHWYTGPTELLREIVSHGYFISINPAVRIQSKHLEIARQVEIENMVLESDGPYNYKGMQLSPKMIVSTARLVAELRGLSYEELLKIIERNYKRLFRL